MEPKAKSALLVMDVQGGIVKMLGEKTAEYLDRVSKVVKAAHLAGIQVFFIVVRFRKGYPEMHYRNKMYQRISTNPNFSFDSDNPETQPVISPIDGDLVIVKKRISAFAGSDLQMLLRAMDISNLVLCGIATSGVVLSTLRQAADKDYGLTVLSDCCADRDEEVNRVLLEKVFPTQASVISSEEWISKL